MLASVILAAGAPQPTLPTQPTLALAASPAALTSGHYTLKSAGGRWCSTTKFFLPGRVVCEYPKALSTFALEHLGDNRYALADVADAMGGKFHKYCDLADATDGVSVTSAQLTCNLDKASVEGFTIWALDNGSVTIKKGEKWCNAMSEMPASAAEAQAAAKSAKQVAAKSATAPIQGGVLRESTSITMVKEVAAENSMEAASLEPTFEMLRRKYGEAAAFEIATGLKSTSSELTCESDTPGETEQFVLVSAPQ